MKLTAHYSLATSLWLVASMVFGSRAIAAGDSQAELMREAMVSQAKASATALLEVPEGVIKSSELEREHGRLIWSFDIATPTSTDITEVNVDARTGTVVAVSRETPATEKKEARTENAGNK